MIVAVRSSTLLKQQTPKPEAQFPEAVPDLSEHSCSVTQMPSMADDIAVVHWLLGNCTTEKSENPLPVLFSEGNAQAACNIKSRQVHLILSAMIEIFHLYFLV